MAQFNLGSYVNTNSWFHRLNPAVKMGNLILVMIGIFIIPLKTQMANLLLFMGLFLVSELLIISAKISFLKLLSNLRPLFFLLTITMILQLSYQKTTPPFLWEAMLTLSYTNIIFSVGLVIIYLLIKRYIPWKFLFFIAVIIAFFLGQYFLPYWSIKDYKISITTDNLFLLAFLFLRISTIILLTSLLTATTMTTSLNYGITRLFMPLKVVKFPLETMAMMISLTFRFIPTIYEESQRVLKAQAARGLDLKEVGPFKKIKALGRLLIPLFIVSFKRAEEIAYAMDVRGYQVGAKRTCIDTYQLKGLDYLSIIVSILLFGGLITYRILVDKGLVYAL